MSANLDQLIDSLRNELQQYGEMLALLEAQHQLVTGREPAAVLTSITAVETQSAAVESARRDRERSQRQLAWVLGLPETESFQEILPSLPAEYRPLVGALVQEINQLLDRVREHALENHSQLQRSLELMGRFIANLSSQAPSALPGQEQNPSDAEPQAPLKAIA